jgi:mono/diheme cytochrome c family protein
MDMKRILVIIGSPVLLFFACGSNGMADMDGRQPKDMGAQLYGMHCSLCHGKDGGLGLNGARDLRRSMLSVAEMKAIVLNGKGVMMPYKNALTTAEVDAVVAHVRTLRVNE